MKLKPNPEYVHRHLFVTLLMAGLSCWFGYDGFIRYPMTPADQLYREIEKADAPEGLNHEAFKKQKTQTQYGFTLLTFLAAAIVGLRLRKATRFDFAFDETGFTYKGQHFVRDDIETIDRSLWDSKSILTLKLKTGLSIPLDAWHHLGVKEFAATLERT